MSDDGGRFAILRQNRGHLVSRPAGGLQVNANGRADWIGWIDLKTEAVNEVSTQNTARIIRDLAPDVLAVVEAENRPSLVRFSEDVLPTVGGTSFDNIMLVDGNDERGIDVGIMLRNGFTIDFMRSHVDDADATGTIFSRDCAEYAITTPAGNRVFVLVNHFKSKGYGNAATSNAKRRRQAQRVKDIYDALVAAGEVNIAVVGDFNDTPPTNANSPLTPLLSQTNLQDITAHPLFVSDGRAGTYANGTASNKIDYVLLSPALFALVTGGGINRSGVWGGVNGTLFPHIPEVTTATEAASDHAAIFADITI